MTCDFYYKKYCIKVFIKIGERYEKRKLYRKSK